MPKTLIVNGVRMAEQKDIAAPDFEEFQLFEPVGKPVRITNSRSIDTRQELKIESEGDIVELRFEDQTTWIGNAQEFQEIFNLTLNRGFDEDTLEIPTVLRASTERGVVQDLALKVISLFKPTKAAVGAAVRDIAKKVEEKVQPQPGLFFLDKTLRKSVVTDIKDVSKPYLLLIHGTNSNTEGAYGGLLAKSDYGLWNFITANYGEKVLAFDHHTLTESPLQNVAELLEALPSNIRLHLITHSRGGLVGDLLCRADAGNGTVGFSHEELELMKDRKADVENMRAINKLAAVKNIRIEKFVRVASPSMGTSLMADRLDHYLNTLLNIIGLTTGAAASPVYMGVKALLAQVASSKTDIDALPGLEAMSPESPFIKMLNNPGNVIEPPLAIISGNCSIHLELKALLVILTKLYFRRKNDLVVDTWSMYFGTPRRRPAQFFLDDKQGVDHVKYFISKESQEAIKRALESTGDAIPDFKPVNETVIAEANRNAAMSFLVSEVKMDAELSGSKPIAVIIPGIMGSNLYKGDDRIWVDFWRFVKGDLLQLEHKDGDNITAKSLMGSGYRRLYKHLSESGYEVVAFAYDWRRDITKEAEKLDELMGKLLEIKQPIHVVAHSMGGVLFREFMLKKKAWDTLNASTGFRALFLGSPLGGSYLIPETLSGRGGSIAQLSRLDLKNGKQDLLKVFAACPGLYSLLPLEKMPHDFGDAATWKTLFKNTNGLGVQPSDDILKSFNTFRDRATNGILGMSDYKNIIYVAGKDDATTSSYVIDNTDRKNGLTFKSTAEGDGSVTWASGIPQVLKEKDAVYYTTTVHGELANDSGLFDAFKQLLQNGTTTALRKVPPAIGSGNRRSIGMADKPRYEILPVTANNLEGVVLGMKPFEETAEEVRLVNVSMSNGDLRYARYPIIVGHFYRDGIMGAERVLDQNFGGLLSEKHALNLYPGKAGTSDVFLSYTAIPRGAIVIGLDEAGALTGYQLELSVAHGASKYLLALREFEKGNATEFTRLFKDGIGVSTVIVGAGYGGLSVENAIKSILLGIQRANAGIALHNANDTALRAIERVEFVEVYEDRALQAYYTIKKLEEEGQLNIAVPRNQIKKLFGVRKRVPLDEQQDWWQRISVSIEKEGKFQNLLRFSASTGAAREELRNLHSNPRIIRSFVEQASKQDHWTPELAKTIFELLIPNDFKDAVRNQNNIVWKLDEGSAAFPWELLQDTATQTKPLCVNSGMVRQLATSEYRTQVQRSYKNSALVVGDPLLHGFVSQLPGARREAEAVANLIAEAGSKVTSNREPFAVTRKINTEFAEIVQALFQDEYKIVHLAGHGDFDPDNPDFGGMIIGDGLFLSSKEIDQMSQVPEFVFVNCCHLGDVNEEREQRAQQFYKLAANIGVQLIKMGVKAVIAAGWAVNDAAALLFAETFYKQMFDGATFGIAIKAARTACFREHRDTNTWGAYQCYGDQFYTFGGAGRWRKKSQSYTLPVEVEIDLINIGNKVGSGRYDKEKILEELKAISEEVDKRGLRDGDITEREAQILADLDEKDEAIEKIRSLRQYEQATFSVQSLERLCNLTVKKLKGVGAEKDIDDVRKEVEAVIGDIEMLNRIGETAERLSLLGSAYKTRFEKTEPENKMKALQQSAEYYRKAFGVAKKTNSDLLYPLCNWLQIENVLLLAETAADCGWGGKPCSGGDERLPKAKEAMGWMDTVLAAQDGDGNSNFWLLMNRAAVTLTKMCLEPNGAIKKEQVLDSVKEAWDTAGTPSEKQSVLDHLAFLLAALEIPKATSAKAKTLAGQLQFIHHELDKLTD